MELINHQKITELKNLFLEFDEGDKLGELYSSTQNSYAELISFGIGMFDEQHKEPVLFIIHRLKNQFKNLGMDTAAEQLLLLKASVLKGQLPEDKKAELTERLKDICFSSFSFLFENYLD